MKHTIKFISIFLCCVMLLTLLGCSDNTNSAIIYYGVDTHPESLDPQTADSFIELMLVRNLYEGLLRENEQGEIVNGVAESYSKSGLVYTFKLNKDAVWADGTGITANDFIFALRRAVNPVTASPNAACLFAIKNAEAIYNGKKNISTLGVKKTDDYTLTIELVREDANFLYTLTTAICMPCNEKFFGNSIGKYGMSYDTVLCNGSYKLTKWNTEDFAMRIAANRSYTGTFIPKNAAVYFTKNIKIDTLESLNKSYVDIAEISASNKNSAEASGFTTKRINNKVWLLSLGKSYTMNMKHSLHLSAINADDFSDIAETYSYAGKIIPDVLGNSNLESVNLYDATRSQQLYNSEIKRFSDNKFPQKVIYYCGDSTTTELVKKIAGHFQQNLGTYINIEKTDSLPELNGKTSNDDYHISIFSTEVNERNVYKYMNCLGVNFGGSLTNDMQSEIFKFGNIVPIAYSGTYFAYDDCLSNITFFNTNGIIDFSFIIKSN